MNKLHEAQIKREVRESGPHPKIADDILFAILLVAVLFMGLLLHILINWVFA